MNFDRWTRKWDGSIFVPNLRGAKSWHRATLLSGDPFTGAISVRISDRVGNDIALECPWIIRSEDTQLEMDLAETKLIATGRGYSMKVLEDKLVLGRIHEYFGNLSFEPQSIEAFVRMFGCLGSEVYEIQLEDGSRVLGEPVISWASEIFLMNRLIRLWRGSMSRDARALREFIPRRRKLGPPPELSEMPFPHLLGLGFWIEVCKSCVLMPEELIRYVGTASDRPLIPLTRSPFEEHTASMRYRNVDYEAAMKGTSGITSPNDSILGPERQSSIFEVAQALSWMLLNAGLIRTTFAAVEVTPGRYPCVEQVPVARNLLGFIYLSMMREMLNAGGSEKQCEICGKPIPKHSSTGRRKKRDARTCCGACKEEAHRKRQMAQPAGIEESVT